MEICWLNTLKKTKTKKTQTNKVYQPNLMKSHADFRLSSSARFSSQASTLLQSVSCRSWFTMVKISLLELFSPLTICTTLFLETQIKAVLQSFCFILHSSYGLSYPNFQTVSCYLCLNFSLTNYNYILLTVMTGFLTGHFDSGAMLWIILQAPLYCIKYILLVWLVFTLHVFDKQCTHIYYWNAHFPFQSVSWFIISKTHILSHLGAAASSPCLFITLSNSLY